MRVYYMYILWSNELSERGRIYFYYKMWVKDMFGFLYILALYFGTFEDYVMLILA